MHVIKLVTTDRSLPRWRSLPSKLKAITDELNTIEGADFGIDVEYRPITPIVANNRITHEWMDGLHSTFIETPEFVAFHMSAAQAKKWGIRPSIRGASQNDDDLVHEFYLWADENTRRYGFNQFIQTFLHEFRHGFMRGCGLPDDTHERHTDGDIRGAFQGLSMARYSPRQRLIERKLTFIEKLRAIILGMPPTTLLHPVPEPWKSRITQGYGIASPRYPRTGRHIGTDYGCPVGTKLLAPWRGRVTTAGTGKATGNFCHFEYEHEGQKWEERWCHLATVPALGEYKRGAVVAVSGNTGTSTGPHLHREKWRNDVRVDLIDKTNWASLTVDPEK